MSNPPITVPAPDPDARWVRLAREGDYEAFEQLVARHEKPIYVLAMRIVRRPEDAEDVVQQTFLSVLEQLGRFEGQSQFRTWLVRVATNHALKILRKRRGLPAVSMESVSEDDLASLQHPQFIAPWRDEPGQVAQQRETQELLAGAMDELDDKYNSGFGV